MKKDAAAKKVHKFGKPGFPVRAEAYLYRKDIECVEIKDGVTGIGDRAFKKCTNLREIRIPASVASIGEFAFLRYSALESAAIPEGVEAIAEGTFIDCTALKEVVIPGSVAEIGSAAFEGCTRAFAGAGLQAITLPSTVESIGNEAVAKCDNFATALLPGGLKATMGNQFKDCPKPTKISRY